MKRRSTILRNRGGFAAGVCWIAAAIALTSCSFAPQGAQGERMEANMVYIPGGTYTPLYASATDSDQVEVQPFLLDEHPVTNADYLRFVQANSEWQRSNVKPLFADDGYLAHWDGDLDFGPDSLASNPVVNVSWFAANAYARWQSKRLPTTAEWELVAAASSTRPDGVNDPEFYQQTLASYTQRSTGTSTPAHSTARNYWGIYDVHGPVREWVLDFNNTFSEGDGRNSGDQNIKLFCGGASIGASDVQDYAAFLRFAFRSSLEARYTVPNLGFRLARDV